MLELLGELAEGAAGAEEPGEALCRAEYLGSTCRLPPCGMLNACLLFRDIIIIFPVRPDVRPQRTLRPRRPRPSREVLGEDASA